MKTVGEELINILESYDVDTVFGIPGVHTVELYRGLKNSAIKHITPRHEQGAGFMADGYARVSGKPGVCFLITGPGLLNATTSIAQAMQDSIPLLIISGVNHSDTIGKNRGHLHELEDQNGVMKKLIKHSYRLNTPEELPQILHKAFTVFTNERPCPVHLEIPLDVMSKEMPPYSIIPIKKEANPVDSKELEKAIKLIDASNNSIILAGGGIKSCKEELIQLAEQIDSPIITTINARSILGSHPLHIPCSASLPTVREEIAKSDLVIAIGTEFSSTDYDIYLDGEFPEMQNLIKVNLDSGKLNQPPQAALNFNTSGEVFIQCLRPQLLTKTSKMTGNTRAKEIYQKTLNALPSDYKNYITLMDIILDHYPDAALVGDSTQITYAGNFIFGRNYPTYWFNSATGFGTLGYAPPAAVGASLAKHEHPTICLVGDGGFQFTLNELSAAKDAGAPVVFLILNNSGYKEIETYMVANDIPTIGVTPSNPDYLKLGEAYDIESFRISTPNELNNLLEELSHSPQLALIEYVIC